MGEKGARQKTAKDKQNYEKADRNPAEVGALLLDLAQNIMLDWSGQHQWRAGGGIFCIPVSFLLVPLSFSIFLSAPISPAVYSPTVYLAPSIWRRLFGAAIWEGRLFAAGISPAPPFRPLTFWRRY